MPVRKKRGGVKSASRKSRPATAMGKTVAKSARTKTAAKRTARKPYARSDHRHPLESANAARKLRREATGVDEDLDYGAATRGHRWSRAPAVYVGGVPDRRQGFGRRASDRKVEDSFIRQTDLEQAADTPGEIPGEIRARRNDQRRR